MVDISFRIDCRLNRSLGDFIERYTPDLLKACFCENQFQLPCNEFSFTIRVSGDVNVFDIFFLGFAQQIANRSLGIFSPFPRGIGQFIDG